MIFGVWVWKVPSWNIRNFFFGKIQENFFCLGCKASPKYKKHIFFRKNVRNFFRIILFVCFVNLGLERAPDSHIINYSCPRCPCSFTCNSCSSKNIDWDDIELFSGFCTNSNLRGKIKRFRRQRGLECGMFNVDT